MEAVAAKVRGTSFMKLPSDLSVPPYFADEPTAIVEVVVAGNSHRVQASGLARARDSDALCFRDLWNLINELAPIDGGCCASEHRVAADAHLDARR
jgi:hypothetical protein